MILNTHVAAQKKSLQYYTYPNDISSRHAVLLDSQKINTVLEEYLSKVEKQGKYFIALDSLICGRDTCIAFMFVQDNFNIDLKQVDSSLVSILEDNGIYNKNYQHKRFDSLSLKTLHELMLDHHTKNGYPFAKSVVRIDTIVNQEMILRYQFDKGKFFAFDSLVNKGNLKINKAFFRNLLEIKDGEAYNHSKVRKVLGKVNQLVYAKSTKDPIVVFENNQSHLHLFLDKQSANRFDALIGVLPKIENGIRKWNISADALIELNNSLGYGEYLFAQYKNLRKDNTDIIVKTSIPYIGTLPLGAYLDFRLFRNGLSNVDVSTDFGGQYLFSGFNNIKVLVNRRSSRLIDVDTLRLLYWNRT
jgi:hypothetical protein